MSIISEFRKAEKLSYLEGQMIFKMDTKLTLTLEKEVIEKAKIYARERNRSLSDLVENYFIALTREGQFGEFEISETVQSLRGSLKVKPEF
jgi:hypothetical protein